MFRKKVFLTAVFLIFILGIFILIQQRFGRGKSRLSVEIHPKAEKIAFEDKAKAKEGKGYGQPAYLGEFNLPKGVQEKIKSFIEGAQLDDNSSGAVLTSQNLEESGLSLKRMSSLSLDKTINNIISAQKIAPQNFDKIFKASLTAANSKPEQMKGLGSEALLELGFLAAEDFELDKAGQAFKTVIEYYPDSRSSQPAYLEYSRILIEQGRLSEARNLIAQAVSVYEADKEFLILAKKLEETINNYE